MNLSHPVNSVDSGWIRLDVAGSGLLVTIIGMDIYVS